MLVFSLLLEHNLGKDNLRVGFPGGAGKESTCQCRRPKRHEFDPFPRVQEDPLKKEIATHSRILV